MIRTLLFDHCPTTNYISPLRPNLHSVQLTFYASFAYFCQNINWLLKGMGDGTLVDLLHVTPKTHLSNQHFLGLRRAQDSFIWWYNGNSTRDLPTKLPAFQTVKIGPIGYQVKNVFYAIVYYYRLL